LRYVTDLFEKLLLNRVIVRAHVHGNNVLARCQRPSVGVEPGDSNDRVAVVNCRSDEVDSKLSFASLSKGCRRGLPPRSRAMSMSSVE